MRSNTALILAELALERAAALLLERLVDRLVRDPHPRIIGELELESLGDLLRAPPGHPAAMLAVRRVAPLPRRRGRPGHRRPARATITPASRFCTYSRNLGLLASLAGFGRCPRRSA